MKFIPKTNWQSDEIVYPEDMNRIEGGVIEVGVSVESHVKTAASTDEGAHGMRNKQGKQEYWNGTAWVGITGVEVINSLISTSTTAALSALQGKTLSEMVRDTPKVEVINNLTSTSTVAALSAAQGRVLKSLIDNSPKTEVVNSLTSYSTTAALSAAQGKVLNDGKQNKLTAITDIQIVSTMPTNPTSGVMYVKLA